MNKLANEEILLALFSLTADFTFQLIEAVVLPMTHKEKFENLGIHPPKGVLLYGPPGNFFSLIPFSRSSPNLNFLLFWIY